jgi:hypothetical protein
LDDEGTELRALHGSCVEQVYGPKYMGGADQLSVLAPSRGTELAAQLGGLEAVSGGEREAKPGRQASEEPSADGTDVG